MMMNILNMNAILNRWHARSHRLGPESYMRAHKARASARCCFFASWLQLGCTGLHSVVQAEALAWYGMLVMLRIYWRVVLGSRQVGMQWLQVCSGLAFGFADRVESFRSWPLLRACPAPEYNHWWLGDVCAERWRCGMQV